jgi:hypothetical protein
VNLSAGVEDRTTGDVIRVANASMAIRLAYLLNDDEEGKPLPALGPPHPPVRFQLAHDPAFPRPGAGVLWVHSMNSRVVAWASTDGEARRVARLLARSGYPVDERSGIDLMFSLPKAHDFGEKLAELPLPASEQGRVDLKLYRKRMLGMAIWLWAPLIAVVVYAAVWIDWIAVLVFTGAWLAIVLLIRRSLRR